MNAKKKGQVLISGAGPSGLAAALLMDQLGWRDIVVVERRTREQGFDRGRAFNYQLEGRGQRLLERVGVTADQMKRFGLPNDHFTLTKFPPHGEPKTVQPPILVPGRKTPYWMTRTRLLALLHEQLSLSGAAERVRILDGHAFDGFESSGDKYRVQIKPEHGDIFTLAPDLVLGCDGLSSRVRGGLTEISPAIAERMRMIVHDSPSAGLTYKVLNLPPRFSVCDGRHQVADHTMAYAFSSTYRDPDKRMALFALPAASSDDPRPVNIILPPTHSFWSLHGEEAVREFLVKGFPQLEVAATAGAEEFSAFAAAPPGQFPTSQYAKHILQALPADTLSGEMQCLLIGDAAHAFPPDLGMGVNSALEDLIELSPHLATGALSVGLARYAAAREPEQAALVRLVQRVHPYQYNQAPWRLKLWTIKFLIQWLLHRLSGRIFEMPGFMLSQRHTMSFVEMERRFNKGNRVFYGLAATAAAIVAWLII